MENLSKQYAYVQLLIIDLEKAIDSFEHHEENLAQQKMLVDIFSKTFQAFCDLIAAYLSQHHKGFHAGTSIQEIIHEAHVAGFLADHDTKTFLKTAAEADAPLREHEENPLIHNLEGYLVAMRSLMSEIKP